MKPSFELILDTTPPRISLTSPNVVAENDLVAVYISANEDLDANLLTLWIDYPDGSTEDALIVGAGNAFTAEINLMGKGLGTLEMILTAYDTVWNQATVKRSVSILPVINRVVTVSGQPVIIQQNTLNITDRINARSTASFTVFSPNNERKFTVGEEVVVTDEGKTIFAGTVSSVHEASETKNDMFYNISAVDFCQLVDKRVVAKTYENKTAGFIVRDMIDSVFWEEGITAGNILEGPLIKKAVFNYASGNEALDQIKDITGLNWNIDHNKKLHLFDRSEYIAPFRLTDTSYNYKGLQIRTYRGEYRNRQYVRAGKDVTQELTEQPTPKPDGVSRNFFTRFPIAEQPRIFINGVEVDPVDIGVNGLDKNKKWYFSYNSNTITHDNDEPVLTNETLSVIYKGLYPIIVVAENPAGVEERKEIEGGSGVYENIQLSQEINLKDVALSYANGLLAKYGVIPKVATFSTYHKGLKAGQLLTIRNMKHGIRGTFLIEEVSARADRSLINYSVKAIDGEALGGWENLFKQFKVKDLTIRENEVLVLLTRTSEKWIWSEQLGIKIYSHPVPSETLYPSTTLYPSPLLESVMLTSSEVVD